MTAVVAASVGALLVAAGVLVAAGREHRRGRHRR
jgi:hypothetical protein